MESTEAAQTITILIAEDDDGHADLIQEHLQEAGVTNAIIRFRDGQEVMDYLAPGGGTSAWNRDRPCLLLLDINMPKMDGMEVLRRLKGDAGTRNIPIIMLTTTDDPQDVEACYRLGCNFYVAKPMGFDAFAETLKRLGLFLQVLQVAKP
jgi:CheY-like chemotaxis protein